MEGGVTDTRTLIAALLHDTVEDTDTTFEEIDAMFGAKVADVVREVTDDNSLPKEDRKRLQIEHAPHIGKRAALVKLADKTSNLRDVAAARRAAGRSSGDAPTSTGPRRWSTSSRRSAGSCVPPSTRPIRGGPDAWNVSFAASASPRAG